MARRRGATPRRQRRPRRRAGRREGSGLRWLLYGLCAVLALAAANFVYQVIRKPTELLFPVSGALYKTPAETWRAYGELFRRYSTAHVSATLLAALAQVEGSGNPLVRTYWRFAFPAHPLDWYRPASSAVGMYQMTDPTFSGARHYCIHAHELAHEGAWDDWHSCWFNGLYLRILPRDAIELTAADLEVKLADILAAHSGLALSEAQLGHLAGIVHLCGAGAGALYARRGLRLRPGERCGDHDPRAYLARLDAFGAEFARLEARAGSAVTQ